VTTNRTTEELFHVVFSMQAAWNSRSREIKGAGEISLRLVRDSSEVAQKEFNV
jgi:hypothetical protein